MTTPRTRIILEKTSVNSPGNTPFWSGFRRRAAEENKRILFPEGSDARVLSAVSFLARTRAVRPALLGAPQEIRAAAREGDFSLEGVEIVDAGAQDQAGYAEKLFERRKSKGLTPEEARNHLRDPLYLACMMLADGKADGVVAGAVRTTADTVRAAFSCVGMAPGASTVFGAFLMECPHPPGGPRRLMFADAAVSPRPSHRALAAVGVEAAGLFRRLTGEPPRVAFLSFSTRGSAEDESAAAVREAAALARKKAPDLDVDGELQGDAALNLDIARQKGAGDSPVAGRANVLIFPDLNAGNIAYKLVQHLGGARAVGPFLAGLAAPMTDLSRGCSDEDVADAAAVVGLL